MIGCGLSYLSTNNCEDIQVVGNYAIQKCEGLVARIDRLGADRQVS
jgi:hypothetical protein